MESEDDQQRAMYLKYKQLNKAFAKKKTPKEETIILDDTLDRNSSSSSEADNCSDEYEKTSIAYNLESVDNDERSNISICSKENILLKGRRDEFIIDKLKPNSK